MYCTVPSDGARARSRSRRRDRGRRDVTVAGAAGVERLRQAEVEQLHAGLVSITLAGFKSRWTMPCRCAAVERVGDLRRRSASSARAAAAPSPAASRQRLAVEQFHHEIGTRGSGLGIGRSPTS